MRGIEQKKQEVFMSEEQKMSPQGEVSLFGNSRFGKWFDNFWYHYKWQTLIALFLVVTLTVCVVQCAMRPDTPDTYICYAGAKDLRPTSTNTTAQDLQTSMATLAGEALEKEDATAIAFHYLIVTNSDNPSTQNLSLSNIESLKAQLDVAGSFLFLMDEALYNIYSVNASGDHYMTDVAPYLKDGSVVETTPDGRGVYLRSTPLASLPGFCDLPSDTILCLRVEFSISGSMSAAKRAEYYKQQEAIFSHLING